MFGMIANIRPTATRFLARSYTHSATTCNTTATATSSQPRSFHSTTHTHAPSSSPPPGKGYDLYVWGGGKGMFSMSSSSSTSPLNTKTLRPSRFISPDATGFTDISFGHKHAAFVTGGGNVYTFGEGLALGHGRQMLQVDTPRRVEGLPPVKQVACGQHHTLALTTDGEVYAFGAGNGILGFQGKSPSALSNDTPTPVRVGAKLSGKKVAEIASGSAHCLIRTEKGELFAFGSGADGRLGTGSSSSEENPVGLYIDSDGVITKITCGSSFNGALDSLGQVYMWGKNERNQLGLGAGFTAGPQSMVNMPERVEFDEYEPKLMKHLSCAYKHTLTVDEDGKLWTFGGMWIKPHQIEYSESWLEQIKFIDAAGGNDFSAAVMENGGLVTWGSGTTGCLGHGNTSSLKEPTQVAGFGSTPEQAGAKDPSGWFGRVIKVLPGHNHCAVLTKK